MIRLLAVGRRAAAAGLFLFLAGLLGACQDTSSRNTQGGAERGEGQPDRVLARVDGEPVTESAVDRKLVSIPMLARGEYASPVGKNRLLHQMVEEEVLYRAALEQGLDREPDVAAALEAQRRAILTQAYLEDRQKSAREVSEEEARAFFEEHRDEYVIEKTLSVRVLINPAEETVRESRRQVVEDGVPFASLCAVRNTNPNLQAASGLLPGPVRRGRAVHWIGNDRIFHEVVFSLEPGELSEVFETVHGFNIAMVEEVREARERSFEDVRSDVEGRIVRARLASLVPDVIDSLQTRYRVEYLETPGPSAEELFAMAQGAPGAREKVAYFEEFVELFPQDPHVPEALFMIGFTKTEELHDPEGAREVLQRVVREFPDSELAQSAQWMLSSDGEDAPPFEGEDGAKAGE